ncbi:hypothetical protein BASA62_006267 [Batrachochytrium salamandrivorans]|nr:hypothetical protein BASA62_006267 [Batrachochytrium salamandrivorans]
MFQIQPRTQNHTSYSFATERIKASPQARRKEEKYSEFVECESKYLESEYDYVKEPSKNRYGENIQVTTIDSDGSQVLLKTIEKENTVFYRLESTSPLKTHMAEIGSKDGRYTSRECKLPEPFNLMLPYEIEMQKYLTQSDYPGSPYVFRGY